MRCASTLLTRLDGVATALGNDGWLVVGGVSDGGRESTRMLGIVRDGEPLQVAHHELGGIGADGEFCEDYDSYCVTVYGRIVVPTLVDDQCLEIRQGPRWSVLHVRVGDRWVDETIEPDVDCIVRYGLERGFVRTTCGPPHTNPICPDPDDVRGR
ncbi:MAG: hypothetical protein JRH11_15445 [Deltaproteobacteria bacterium]|nr:hypothetical protein [Deltaproteobacteria bacterium]